jgi:hypothetical protein
MGFVMRTLSVAEGTVTLLSAPHHFDRVANITNYSNPAKSVSTISFLGSFGT